MKGDAGIIKTLNSLLADELTAINQYIVHSEMCGQWGYKRLDREFKKRAIDEMGHAEKLIARILFLDGRPVVTELRKITIGAEVPEMLANDHALESGAIKAYNAAIKQCDPVDFATQEILEDILEDEDEHINGIEGLQDQIKQMTLPIFLAQQIKK